MGILTIQFGQCGNQVGHSLFTYLANDLNYQNQLVSSKINNEYVKDGLCQWFNDDKMAARSILIDTENKVISKIRDEKGLVRYRNIVAKSEGGSANNWAFGYFEKSGCVLDEVLDLVRKEFERSDEILSVFNILSCGGGTGSGVGSAIVEKLREEYPNKVILNCLVLPYNEGEVVTQNYNTLLTLIKLYDNTDGSFIFENADLHKICSELLAIKDIKLTNINSVIAQKVAAVLQPAHNLSISNLTNLTSHPGYKFLQIKSVPHIPDEYIKFESVQKWPTLINRIKTTLQKKSTQNSTFKSVGSLLLSRGGLPPENSNINLLTDDDLYASWLPFDQRVTHCHSIRNLYNTSNFLALATNNGSIVNTLDPIVEDAWNLFNNGAFVHQYEQFGMTGEDFQEAFIKIESIIQGYKML